MRSVSTKIEPMKDGGPGAAGSRREASDRNKRIVRQWNRRIWSDEDVVFSELAAADLVVHCIGGLDELRDTIRRMRQVFSDIELEIHDQIAEGDRVVTRWILHGTHCGTLWGVPPSGRRLSYSGITINRLEGGRIAEEWYEGDLCGLMEQMGIPLPV